MSEEWEGRTLQTGRSSHQEWVMKGLGGKRKVNKVLPEHLLVAHSVPWIPDFFTLRTFPTP